MILPIEADDALDSLRIVRTLLAEAVDALNQQSAPVSLVQSYTYAMDAVSWSIERLTSGLAAVSTLTRQAGEMESVEERRVEGGTFPWTELDP